MFFCGCESSTGSLELDLLRFPIAGFDKKNVNDGVYFNDFIKLNLVQDILKRVIMNEMTGSSWGFKRFDRICLTVNRNKFREVSQ